MARAGHWFWAALAAGLVTTASSAAPPGTASPSSSPHRLLLDLRGDGLDLGGQNPKLGTRWTRPGTDDAFLALDADELTRMGYRIEGRDRSVRRGVVPFADDLRLTRPDGTPAHPADCWELLAALDGTRDGVLDTRDPVWRTLRLFVDANGDGVIALAEVRALDAAGVTAVGPRLARPARRAAEGTFADGVFVRAGGSFGRAADVGLARVEDRARAL